MPTFEVQVEIEQPPDVVEQAFLDPENAVFWTTDLKQFEVVSRKPGEVGSVAHLHFVQGSRRYIMKDELLEFIPRQYFKSRVSGNGINALVETRLQDLGESTKVEVKWSGTVESIRLRIMLFLMRRVMVRQTQSELEQFKSLVELHGAHFAQ